jgi:hypothetical protein
LNLGLETVPATLVHHTTYMCMTHPTGLKSVITRSYHFERKLINVVQGNIYHEVINGKQKNSDFRFLILHFQFGKGKHEIDSAD